jgi:hypothetical protein
MGCRRGGTITTQRRTRRRRGAWLAPLLPAALLLLALGWCSVGAGTHLPSALTTLGPTYTVAGLQRQVAGDPRHWLGRTVLVKGVVASIGDASGPEGIVLGMTLTDPGEPSGATDLTVVWGPADPLLGFLRHLPLIGQLAPRAQAEHWDTIATYRVRLRAAPASACQSRPCYEALLLDAPPPVGFRLGVQ